MIEIGKATEKDKETTDEFNFYNLRKHAMLLSYYKYGAMQINYFTGKYIDCIASMKKRLSRYILDKNTEFMVDVCNFAMIEYVYPSRNNSTLYANTLKESWDNIDNYKDLGEKEPLASNLQSILNTEYSVLFDAHMDLFNKNNFKKFKKKTKANFKKLNNAEVIGKLIDIYTETGYKECLLAIGLYSKAEFLKPQLQDAKYWATDSKNSPGIVGMGINEIKAFKDMHD